MCENTQCLRAVNCDATNFIREEKREVQGSLDCRTSGQVQVTNEEYFVILRSGGNSLLYIRYRAEENLLSELQQRGLADGYDTLFLWEHATATHL
jgi:hypothetical protein